MSDITFDTNEFEIVSVDTTAGLITSLDAHTLMKLYYIVNTHGEALIANTKSFRDGEISLSLNCTPRVLFISKNLEMLNEKKHHLFFLANNTSVHLNKSLSIETINDFIRKIEKHYKINFSKIFQHSKK